MSVCLPCAKEIINDRAESTLLTIRKFANAIPMFVSIGRLTAVEADSLLESFIVLEKDFIEQADLALDNLVATVKSPWVPSPATDTTQV